jgi:hypothetical protein
MTKERNMRKEMKREKEEKEGKTGRPRHVVKVDPSGRSGSVYGSDCRPRTEVNKNFFDGYHRKRSIFIISFLDRIPEKASEYGYVERHGNENHGRNILMGFCLEARKRNRFCSDPLRPLGIIGSVIIGPCIREASGF